jgi:LCP family protein required for cell wall assembly
MKPTELEPLNNGPWPIHQQADRLTQILIWVAFFLIAALVAVAVDLWLWPSSSGTVVQAIGPTPLPPTLTPTPWSTELPEVQPTASAVPPTAEAASPTPATPPPCVPPDDWGIHIVQPGNTLFSLARRYGTDVDTLMSVNCLNTHTIFIDQRLYVPGPLATPTTSMPVALPTQSATSTPRLAASATPVNETTAVAALKPTATPAAALSITIPDHYVNIVLLGSDKRPRSGAWRTDSMIIVSVDTKSNVVRLLSIPRDLWVFIPGHGNNRINTADLWGELAKKGGGPERVKQTIHYNLGIPIHYYVRVDFAGFIKIIDAVGGIDVDVDCALTDINLSAGIHHMDGKQALRYARSRKSTNDFDRGRRQRKVLMALWDQALSLDIIPRLPELWWAMADAFETDIPLDQVINLAYVGIQLKPQRIVSRSISGRHVQGWITPQGAAVLLPRQDKLQPMLKDFFASEDLGRLDQTENVRIRVLNGSQRHQAAQLAASALRWEGFKVVGTGNADRQDYAQTAILVYNGDQVSGTEVAQLLGVPVTAIQDLTSVPEQPDPANPVDIQIILGRDYNPCRR